MAVTYNFLDFYNLFVNEIVGNPNLFVIIALLLSAIVLIRMRAPVQVFIPTMVAVAGILAIRFRTPLLLIVVLFSFGFFGYMMARIRRE